MSNAMKKNGNKKRLFMVLLLLMIGITMKLPAEAKVSAPKYPKKITVYYGCRDGEKFKDYKKPGREKHIAILTDESNSLERGSNIKSSNPKVAKAEYDMGIGGVGVLYIRILPNVKGNNIATGKTTFSFTVTLNGKKYPISIECTIKKATTPFSTFKIDGKEYKPSLNKKWEIQIPSAKKVKVKYKLKSKDYQVSYYSKNKMKKVKTYYGETVKIQKEIKLKSGDEIKNPTRICIYPKAKGYDYLREFFTGAVEWNIQFGEVK